MDTNDFTLNSALMDDINKCLNSEIILAEKMWKITDCFIKNKYMCLEFYSPIHFALFCNSESDEIYNYYCFINKFMFYTCKISKDKIEKSKHLKYQVGTYFNYLKKFYIILDNYDNKNICGKVFSENGVTIDYFYFNKFIGINSYNSTFLFKQCNIPYEDLAECYTI